MGFIIDTPFSRLATEEKSKIPTFSVAVNQVLKKDLIFYILSSTTMKAVNIKPFIATKQCNIILLFKQNKIE